MPMLCVSGFFQLTFHLLFELASLSPLITLLEMLFLFVALGPIKFQAVLHQVSRHQSELGLLKKVCARTYFPINRIPGGGVGMMFTNF